MYIGKRIRSLRKALKMTQEEFAERLGVNQGYVSKWESGAREVVNLEVFDQLLAHVGAPDVRPCGHRKPSRYSPIVYLPGAFKTASVLSAMFSSEVSDDEWLSMFERLIWPSSKDPYAESAILKAGGLANWPLPQKVVDSDIELHGEEFLRTLARYRFDTDFVDKTAWRVLRHKADSAAIAIFEDVVSAGKPSGISTDTLEAIEVGDMPKLLGPEWENAPTACVFGFDFSSLIFSMIFDSDGQLNKERSRAAQRWFSWWRDQRRDHRNTADSRMHDHLSTIREFGMQLAIDDYNDRNRPRRGRPRKAAN